MSAATYAAPIVAIDQVIDVSEHGIQVIKAITGNEAFFLGHYPGFPIFPGVFVVEVVHQATCAFVSRGLGVARGIRLAEIRSVRFLSPLGPGDVLMVDARCTREQGDSVAVDAHCSRRGATPIAVARVKLRYVLRD